MMYVIVDVSKIADDFVLVEKIAASKTTSVLTENVFIDVEDGRLKYSVTNFRVSISGSVDVDCSESGGFAVNARILGRIFRSSKRKSIEIIKKNNTLIVKSGAVRYELILTNSSPSTVLRPSKDVVFQKINGNVLSALMRKVLYAASNDITRPNCNCVVLDFKEKRSFATDGHRLAMARDDFECNLGVDKIVIPKESVDFLVRFWIKNDGCEIAFGRAENGNAVLFTKAEEKQLAICMREIEPLPCDRVIPDFETGALLKKADVVDALKRLSILSVGKGESKKGEKDVGAGHCLFTFNDKVLSLRVSTNFYGAAEEKLNIETGSENGSFLINSQYVNDFMNEVDSERVWFFFDGSDELAPVLIRQEDGRKLGVIMPIRR